MSERRIEDLFERFRAHGDAAALGRVFDETAPQLLRIARHVAPDKAEAEDLVQATFLAAIEKRDTFDRSRRLEPWLTGILLNQASLARRARARVIDPDRLDSRASQDPLDAAGARELSEALTIALARLGPADREVLLPLLMDGRRAVEIARELGRRPDTIHMRIHRGLARLRRLLPASFALGALIRSGHARGLGAVRSEVLRAAHLQPGSLAAAGTSIAVASWGLTMTTKQIGLVVTALAVVLGIGGSLVSSWVSGAKEPDAATIQMGLAMPVDGAPRDRGTVASTGSAPASDRSALPALGERTREHEVELELIRSNKQPAAGALVAFIGPDRSLTSAKTDADGRCTFTASSGSSEVYIRDDATFPIHMGLEITHGGRRTLELPGGHELSGQLLMAGIEPLPPLELELSTDNAPQGFADAEIGVFKALDLMRYESKRLTARTKPDRTGTFAFHALPVGWSGTLSLPAELVFVVDGVPSRSSEHLFASASTALRLPIAYRPRIVGRIVEADTHAPVAAARFNARLHWFRGDATLTGSRTDAEGRFTIALDYRTDVVGITIDRVHAADGRFGRAAADLQWSGPCEPCDAGDIVCAFPAARPLEIHVVDLQGEPVAGARAKVDHFDVVIADDRGVGRFAAAPLDAEQMRVVAPGHRIASVPLSADTASPLEVVLAPANRLTITLPPEAVGRNDLSVALVSTPLLFGGNSRMYDWILRGGMVGRCSSANGNDGTREGAVHFAFSPEGRIEVEDVLTGVPFRVQLRSRPPGPSMDSIVTAEVRVESLGPEEHRLIEFSLDHLVLQASRQLRGRAVDEQGQPILGAGVSTCFGCGLQMAQSDIDGSFEIGLDGLDSTDVEISKRGYVPFRVRDWNLALDRPLEARLLRGQDLRVEVVDTRGRPIDQVYIAAEIPGFGPPGKIEHVSTGVFALCDMPDDRVGVVVRVAGRSYESTHETRSGVASFSLPEHGRLEVAWSPNSVLEESKSYRLALRPVGTDDPMQTEWTPWPERIQTYAFENVLPGEYTIGLEVGAVRNADDVDLTYEPLHAASRVTIVGGETRKVELRP